MLFTPGLVDVHVHLREPGFSYKETIETGTAAAARGGFVAVCAMPNVLPAPDGNAGLSAQEARIREGARVRVYPYGTITKGGRGAGELADFAAMHGRVIAYSDDGNGVQSDETMRTAMVAIKHLDGMIAAHCEDLRFPDAQSEWRQLARDLRLVRETGCRYHACHLSCKESVELMREAKREGLDVSCETAPHYLLLSQDDARDEGRFRMNPPLRTRGDREALLEAALDGTIDLIATDHAPHAAYEKDKGLHDGLNGIVGLETAFPALYTGLVESGKMPLERLLCMLCDAPRARFGIPEAGDMAVFDLQNEWTIESSAFASKGRSTPFDGMRAHGRCVTTVCGGEIVWQA